jgi:hypothetical protein
MKKITKIAIAILFSVASVSSVFAGELSVTGNAKATYTIVSSDSTTGTSSGGKGIGIANEFSLSGAGELDNGMTWNYAQDIDGATVQDDAKLTLTTDYGTVGVFVSEGGISSKYKWDVTSYAPGSDYGISGGSGKHATGGVASGYTYGDDIGGFNNFQYHTPAGILPLGLGVKIAYAPNGGTNANASSNAAGTVPAGSGANTVEQIQVNAAPIDGLTLSASYIEKKDNGSKVSAVQSYEAGGASGKFAYGPVSVGIGKFYVAPSLAVQGAGTYAQYYENDAMAIGFAATDNLSVSYSEETSELNKQTMVVAGTAAAAKTDATVEQKITALQAAYTAGGATLSIASKSVENSAYTAAVDRKETVFAVVMAF